jgi:hypothetical protein
MNQRIRELIEQNFIITTDGKIGHVNNYMAEKFAESIVRECAAVCDLYAMPDGTSQTAMILSAAIKSKFGVE